MWYGLISLTAGIIATIVFLVSEFNGDFFEVLFALTVGVATTVAWPMLLLGGLIWLIAYPFVYGFKFKRTLSPQGKSRK